MLTKGLRDNGDLDIAYAGLSRFILYSSVTGEHRADILSSDNNFDTEAQPTMRSQFVRELAFVTQTQAGPEYCSTLCRFYATLAPDALLDAIIVALASFTSSASANREEALNGLVIKGTDRRGADLRGHVTVRLAEKGTLCTFERDLVRSHF